MRHAAQKFEVVVERFANPVREMLRSSPKQFRGYLAEKLRRRRQRLRDEQAAAMDPVLIQRAKVERATLRAVRAYSPGVFDGRMAVFLPSKHWPVAQRWKTAAAQVEEHVGPEGCDSQDMLREPHAGAFAGLFKRAMPQ